MPTKNKLTETVQAAAENASRALIMLCHEKVTVEVAKMEVLKIQSLCPDIVPEAIVAGISLPVIGKINGVSLLIFPAETAYLICDLLFKRKTGATRKLSQLDISALKEVANMLCGSFLSVFSNTLKVTIIGQVPIFSLDKFGSVVDGIIALFARRAEDAFAIEVNFNFETTRIKGYVIFIFDPEEMKAVIKVMEQAETAG